MPEAWGEVAGAVNTLTTFFDFGARYGYSTYRLVEGKSAKEMLDRIDEILKDANQVLENHKPLLPEGQYPALKVAHRRLHLNLAEEKKDFRATEDELIRNSRILSKIYGSRESHHHRVADLLEQAEAYHTNVVSASRHAQVLRDDEVDEEEDFPDLKQLSPQPSASTDLKESQQEVSEYCTTWLSVLNPPSRSCSSLGLESAYSEPSPIPESSSTSSGDACSTTSQDRSFIAAVTHIPQSSTSATDPNPNVHPDSTETGYRRMILLEGMGKRVVIIDPRFHSLDETDPYISDSSLRALSREGERLMKIDNTQNIEGNRTIGPEGPSLSSLIESFMKTKMGAA